MDLVCIDLFVFSCILHISISLAIRINEVSTFLHFSWSPVLVKITFMSLTTVCSIVVLKLELAVFLHIFDRNIIFLVLVLLLFLLRLVLLLCELLLLCHQFLMLLLLFLAHHQFLPAELKTDIIAKLVVID
jgi:hypothetical protein